MRSKVEDIVEALGSMSCSELRQVKAAADVLLKADPTQADSGSAEIFWRALVAVGADRGIRLPELSCVNRIDAFRKFSSVSDSLSQFLVEQVSCKDKTDLVIAMRLAARALVSRLCYLRTAIGLEVTPKIVMQQAENTIASMDVQWPGGPVEWAMIMRTRAAKVVVQ